MEAQSTSSRRQLIIIVVVIVIVAILAFLLYWRSRPTGSELASTDPDASQETGNTPMTLLGNDLRALVANSPLIFVGEIASQETVRDERGLIITRSTFNIDQTIKGDFAEPTITLTLLGGTLDNETMRVSHLPTFETGRTYFIFTDASRTTYNPITGNEAGVFLVNPDRTAVYTYTGIGISGVDDNGLLVTSNAFLSDLYRDDPNGPQIQDSDPQVDGDIVSVEPDVRETRTLLSADAFVEIIRGLSGQTPESSG